MRFYLMKAEAITSAMLVKMFGIDKRRKNFMSHLVGLILRLGGRLKFCNLSRYSDHGEQYYRQNFGSCFPFAKFNLLMVMKHAVYISTIIFALTLVSCERIKNKGQKIFNKTEEIVKDKSEDLVDKVIPHFDAHNPDTKFNKERFKDFLKVDLTPDVKNIYCFDDAIGIDADYMFAFNCEESTAKKIIEKHQLKLDKETTSYAFGLQHDFTWWDKKKIEKLDLYSWKGEHQYFKYFWYDKIEQKAYYFDFDM